VKSVRLFDYISFESDSWQVVAQDGPELALKSLTTNRIRRVPVADLLADESYLPDSSDRLPSLDNVAVLDTLDPTTREQTITLHRHVYEVLNGVPRAMARPRSSRRTSTASTTLWNSASTPRSKNYGVRARRWARAL